MKTEYRKVSFKDNITTAAVLTATLVAMLSTIVNSTDARAAHDTIQQMDTIVITAPRIERTDISRMDTIVVTATRESNVLVASN